MFEQIRIFKWLRETSANNTIKYDLASSAVPTVTPADLELDMNAIPIYDTRNFTRHFPALREMLAARYELAAEDVLLTTAASGANFIVPAALLERGDEALCEEPYYEPQWRSAQAVGAKVNFFRRRPEENFRLNPDEIKKTMTPKTRLIILSNLHNPSMQLATDDEIAAVADVAARNGATVLVDEVYRELLFDRIPRTAMKVRENIVVTSSFSKALGLQGLRLGWALARPEVMRRALNVLQSLHVGIPTPSAHILMRALAIEPKLHARARSIIEGKIDILRRWARERGDVRVIEPYCGANALVKMPDGLNTLEFCNRLARERGVMMDPGELFRIPGHVRISMMEKPDMVEAALRETGSFLDEMLRGQATGRKAEG